MAHEDISSPMFQANRIDPLVRFGIKIEPRNEECVGDWEARAYDDDCYGDQKAYNRAKWAATELVIAEWKKEVTNSRSMYDLFVDRDPANSAIEAIELLDSVLERIPAFVQDRRVDWHRTNGKRQFEPSYWQFKALFDILGTEIATATGATKKALAELHEPLTAWSNNSTYSVEKLGFIPITAAQRVQHRAAAKAEKDEKAAERRSAKANQARAEHAASADELLANVRARKRGSIAPH